MKYESEHYFNTEDGSVKNKLGQVIYYIEFSSSESYLVYRNTDGDIFDFTQSGNVSGSFEKEERTRVSIYKDWNYHEELN